MAMLYNLKLGKKKPMRTRYLIMISIVITALSGCQLDVDELDGAGIGEIEASASDTGQSPVEEDSGSDLRDGLFLRRRRAPLRFLLQLLEV